jgi:putative SOS response-associated peptidase YedK
MCGRARLATDYSEIKIRLRFGSNSPAPNLEPSWNIPPTGRMLVATYMQGGERISETMHWGLIPAWSKDGKVKFPTFNARAETVDTLNTFRDAWRKGRRCLVVTDGFYEWRKSDKQPFCDRNGGQRSNGDGRALG